MTWQLPCPRCGDLKHKRCFVSAELIPAKAPEIPCPECGAGVPVPDHPVTELPCLACGAEWFKAKVPVRVEVDANGKVTFKGA